MRRRSNQLNPMRMLVMLAVLWGTGIWLFAAENTPPAPKVQPAQATPVPAQAAPVEATAQAAADDPATDAKDSTEKKSPAETAASAQEGSKDSAKDSKQASAADKSSTPQRFVPSEQVRADFDVSFPIDI